MLRMSYCDHFSSVVRPCVRPSVNIFQTTSPLKPLSQFCSNFIWSLLRVGERKIAKMVVVRRPRWPPCPYMVKTFKNLLLHNRGCLGAESLHESSGTECQPKLLKYRTLTFDLFTARSSSLPYAFVWALYIWMGKLLRISNDCSSEASEPILFKLHMEPP